MKGQELKDYIKQNHKDFGGSMTNQQIANHAMVSNARVSQIKSELKSAILDKVSEIGQEIQPEAA